MSLNSCPIDPVPSETARVARAVFPKGNRYMTMRDELGILYPNDLFADLYPRVGHYGEPPWCLALVTPLKIPFSWVVVSGKLMGDSHAIQ